MRALLASIFVVCSMIITPALAQTTAAEENMKILIEKIKADKKLVIAANMDLTDAEASGFWPVYDAYQRDLQVANQRMANAIINYVEAYNAGDLTDEQASFLISEAIGIEQYEADMLEVYASKLASVLPPTKVARYLQIENKIRATIRYEIAAALPLVD